METILETFSHVMMMMIIIISLIMLLYPILKFPHGDLFFCDTWRPSMMHKKAITKLAGQFDNASTAKDDMRKAYEKCNDIPQENHSSIDTFLKQESDKDNEMHLAMFRKAEK
ncbi:hypothetical protein Tco_0414287 [Tanacetum coccineum]